MARGLFNLHDKPLRSARVWESRFLYFLANACWKSRKLRKIMEFCKNTKSHIKTLKMHHGKSHPRTLHETVLN